MPSELDSPPKAEAIRALHEHIETDPGWIAQRELDSWMKAHYFEEQTVITDDTANEERNRRIDPESLPSGEAARACDLVGSFYPEPPIIGVHYVGVREKSPAAGENVAIALNEAIDQLNPAADSPWRTGVFNQILYGRSADLIAKGHDYWFDFPDKNDGEIEKDWEKREALWRLKAPIPVAWISLPPESTFPASLSTINDEVLCLKTVSWADIVDMFDEKELSEVEVPKASDKNWYNSVKLAIYSNRHSIAYMILADEKTNKTLGMGGTFADKIVRTVEHGLGRSAIRILPGLVSGRKEPPYYWRPLLYPVMGLLETIDRLGSRALTSAKFGAYPWMKVHMNDDSIEVEGDSARAKFKKNFEGDISFLNAGDAQSGQGREDINPVFQPEAGEEIRELFIWALDRIGQITGANAALEGQLSTNQAAWSHNWSSEQSRRKLQPLTSNVIARAIDISESISLATQAFGETIVLAKPDEKGQIKLKPDDLEDWQPVIVGTFDAKTPTNWTATWDMGMSLMERTKALGYGPSPKTVMEKFMGIHEPWTEVMGNMEFQMVLSDEMMRARNKLFVERFEAQLAEDEGMGLEELANIDLPDDIKQALMSAVQNTPGEEAPGQNGQSRVSPQTAGVVRAGTPGITQGTGPQPTERLQ